jgi:pimeloyl-ACP methyl ester carboxylesterase
MGLAGVALQLLPGLLAWLGGKDHVVDDVQEQGSEHRAPRGGPFPAAIGARADDLFGHVFQVAPGGRVASRVGQPGQAHRQAQGQQPAGDGEQDGAPGAAKEPQRDEDEQDAGPDHHDRRREGQPFVQSQQQVVDHAAPPSAGWPGWKSMSRSHDTRAGSSSGSGSRPKPDGQVELAYPPEWEAHIFATTPAGIWRDVPGLHLPALVVRGELSTIFRPESQARMARLLPQARFATIPAAGHLVLMEQPAATGALLQGFLQDCQSTCSGRGRNPHLIPMAD